MVKGATADEAYVEAGYAQNRHNASRLKTSEPIRNRILSLQAQSAARIVEKATIDKGYVLHQARRMYEASAEAAVSGEEFDPKSANVASRFLDQVGRHVDVQAFKDQSDINLHVTLDTAIQRLESAVVEAEYEVIEDGSL